MLDHLRKDKNSITKRRELVAYHEAGHTIAGLDLVKMPVLFIKLQYAARRTCRWIYMITLKEDQIFSF